MKRTILIILSLFIISCNTTPVFSENPPIKSVSSGEVKFNFEDIEDIIYSEEDGYYLEYMDADIIDLDRLKDYYDYNLDYVKIIIHEEDMPDFLNDYDNYILYQEVKDYREIDELDRSWIIKEYQIVQDTTVHLVWVLERY